MGMQKSLERKRNADTISEYDWWPGKIFLRIAKQLERMGPEAKVRMYEGLKENGMRDLWLEVFTGEESKGNIVVAEGGGTNDSRPCPPLC